jgi:hypothetical protein
MVEVVTCPYFWYPVFNWKYPIFMLF